MQVNILTLFILLSGTAKIAFVHHANQSLADNGALALQQGDPGYVGNSYHRTLDTHFYYGKPIDIHMSGPLAQSYGWMQNGHDILGRLRNSDLVYIVGGSYAENILPYADREINEFSMWYVQQVYDSLIKGVGYPDLPNVIWIPERVWKSQNLMPYSLIEVLNQKYGKYDSNGNYLAPCILLDDNVHEWYSHTFPDGTECHNSHKVHIMYDNSGNYVFVVFIQQHARNDWVWNEVWNTWTGSEHLPGLANSPDQEQVCVYGDDWEKAAGVAGWDFGQPGAPANSYDANIAWASSQSWIQFVHVAEVARWWGVDKLLDSDPYNDPPSINIDYAAYPELHGWTGGNYDNWYHDFENTQAYECSLAPDLNGNGVSGDYEDLWKEAYNALMSAPDNRISKLGWVTLSGMLYETAWHTGPGGELVYWGRNLWNHTRYGVLFAEAAKWLDTCANISGGHIRVADLDGDGMDEYAIFNSKIWAAFDRRGGRALLVATSDGDVVVGNLMSNWGGEGDYDDGGHPGLFHDSQAENSWFNVTVDSSGDTAILTLAEAYDYSGNPSTDLVKTIKLASDDSYLIAQYQSTWTNWTKAGVTPDIWNVLLNGYELSFISGISPNGWVYSGWQNDRTGAKAVFLWASGNGLVYHNLGKMASVAEKIELGNGTNYTVYFYAGRGQPDVNAQGPGDREGPFIVQTWQSPDEQIRPEDSVLVVSDIWDIGGVQSAWIRYGVNGNWSYPDIPMVQDDGGTHDWDSDGQPDPNLWGGYIPPQPVGSHVEYAIRAVDSSNNESWDNNYGQNYDYFVGVINFQMDGQLDRVATLASQNGGMHLWYYFSSDTSRLYIATEAAGNGPDSYANDHFIFVAFSDDLTLMPAPWAKSGSVGHYSFFLADENDNDFVGWFDSTGNLMNDTTKFRCAAGATENDILEGVLYLDNIFGGKEMPQNVWIAVGTYQTQDNGSLQWQVPRPPDGVVDSILSKDEFLHIDLSTGIVEEPSDGLAPIIFALKTYPAPFTSWLALSFSLSKDSDVKIQLYDAAGREVKSLFDGHLTRGKHELSFDCDSIAQGVYFLRVSAGMESRTLTTVKLK